MKTASKKANKQKEFHRHDVRFKCPGLLSKISLVPLTAV